MVESDGRDIAKPEIKRQASLITGIKNGLNTLYKKLTTANAATKKDGAPRRNSVRRHLEGTIAGQESALAVLQEEMKRSPERVDASSLEDYQSIQRVDDEGKYLFAFVTASVWNARRQMVDWLQPHFDEENELVDLFYAITNGHGWIKSTRAVVTVRLEPLQQPRRRLAQEQLRRKQTLAHALLAGSGWPLKELRSQFEARMSKKKRPVLSAC